MTVTWPARGTALGGLDAKAYIDEIFDTLALQISQLTQGTGDMRSSDNLSTLVDFAAARSYLGVLSIEETDQAIQTALVSAGAVVSVNGEVGAVALGAADIPFVPGGTLSSTDVQAAILEVEGIFGTLDAGAVGADPSGTAVTAVATHEAAADPHPGYQKESEKGSAGGYAPLDGSSLLADSFIPSTIARDAEVTAAVSAAVAALIASAPGALDTLDELAAALGDDPNFATTISTLIGTKVPQSLFDANTILAATSDNTPAALTIGEQTIVGRVTGGNIAALTPSQVRTLAGVVPGTDVQAFDADLAAIAALTTTSYGRSFLPLADAAAARTLIAFDATIEAGGFDSFGLAAAVVTGGNIAGGAIDPISKLHISNSYTQTADSATPFGLGTTVLHDHNVIVNFPGSGIAGPQLAAGTLGPAGLWTWVGTTQYNYDSTLLAFPPIIMLNQRVLKNQPGTDKATTPAWALLMAPIVIGDGGKNTINRPDAAPGGFPYVDTQIWATNDGGEIDGEANDTWLGSFLSTPFIFGDTHLYRRVAFHGADMNEYRPGGPNTTDLSDAYRLQLIDNGYAPDADPGAGTVEQNIILLVERMDGGTHNIGVWNESGTVEPPYPQGPLVAGSVLNPSATVISVSTGGGGTANVTLTDPNWMPDGLDGQRVRINSNNTTGKITYPNGGNVAFIDSEDRVQMPGTGFDLVYAAAFATWTESQPHSARHLYSGTLKNGGAFRTRSTGAGAAAFEFYNATTDAYPTASFGMAASGVGSFGLGPGGASPLDVAIARTGVAAFSITGQATFATGITMADATNVVLNATTGTKIGTATSQKLGFLNATPVAQQANSVDLGAVLSNFGLRASGGNPPLNLGTGALTSGAHTVGDGTAGDGSIVLSASNAFGSQVSGLNIFKSTADTQPTASLLSVGGLATLAFGVGGSTATSASLAFTGSAALTLTGQLTVATGITMADATNVVLNATTGTKIGTATSQKLGFLNATPVAQQANSVDLGDVLSNFGLRASGGNPPLNLGTGALTSGAHTVGDGTAGDGKVVASASNVGVQVSGINIYKDTSDTQPTTSLLSVNGLATLAFGVGGTTATSASLAFTGSAALTLTGQLTVATGITMANATNIAVNTSTGTKIGTATTQKLGMWNVTPVIQPATTGTTTGFTAATGTAVLSGSTFTGGTGSKAYTIGDVVLALKQAGIMAAS